jgi:hypothetical protein
MILRDKNINGQDALFHSGKEGPLLCISAGATSTWLYLTRHEGHARTVVSFYPPIEGDEGCVYLYAPQSGAPDFYWSVAPKNKR